MQTRNRNRVSSTVRFFTPMTVMAALSLCLPLSGAYAQPADAEPAHASKAEIEYQTQPSLTATQALQRMLELIRSSSRVTDITPETVHRIFGVQAKVIDQDRFGYGQRLPGNWAFSLERLTGDGIGGTRLDLIFDPIPGAQASPLPTTCEPNFAQFTEALVSMGFSRQSRYGEHGRWIFDAFERPGMYVEVSPLSAFADSGEPLGSTCVKMVLVR